MLRTSIVLAVLALGVAAAGAQPRTGARAGGFTPFRDRGFGGTTVDAVALIQETCPLSVAITSLSRDERGVTVSLRLANESNGTITRHTVFAWAVARDGAVRGYRQLQSSRTIARGGDRRFDVALTGVGVQSGDVVVVAVQEASGAAPWRRDARDLERDVKEAIANR